MATDRILNYPRAVQVLRLRGSYTVPAGTRGLRGLRGVFSLLYAHEKGRYQKKDMDYASRAEWYPHSPHAVRTRTGAGRLTTGQSFPFHFVGDAVRHSSSIGNAGLIWQPAGSFDEIMGN